MDFKYNLGDEVKHKLHGFAGVITARIEYATGCLQYHVNPKKLKDGKPLEAIWFDETTLTLTKKANRTKKKLTGGPQPTPNRDCSM